VEAIVAVIYITTPTERWEWTSHS